MEQFTDVVIMITTNLLATGGLLVWLTKRHADKLDKLLEDMASVKTTLGMLRGDHEKLIRVEHTISKTDHDLNVAFNLLRDIKKNERQRKNGKDGV